MRFEPDATLIGRDSAVPSMRKRSPVPSAHPGLLPDNSLCSSMRGSAAPILLCYMPRTIAGSLHTALHVTTKLSMLILTLTLTLIEPVP